MKGTSSAEPTIFERRVADPRATVIFVHGALDRAESFARMARHLDEFDVVAYDRRGYQHSRDVAPVTLDNHVEDLLRVVNREERGRAVIAFGHSFGGVVTWGAALRDPTRINLVVNYEAPFPWLLRHDHPRPAPDDDPAREAELFFSRVVSAGAWSKLSAAQRDSRRRDGPALLVDLREIRRAAPPYDLAKLRTPSTYVHGDGAHSNYYRRLGETLHSLNPEITAEEITDSDHSAHLRRAPILSSLITEHWAVLCG